MSDFPNGRPPGQNNLDAGTEQYVPKEHDPSAGAQKPDEDRPEEDGIEVREDDTDDETKQELRDAARNVVEPSTAEPPKQQPKREADTSKTAERK